LFFFSSNILFAEEVQIRNIEVTGNTVATSPVYIVRDLRVSAEIVPLPPEPGTGNENENVSYDISYATANAFTLEADNVAYLEANRYVEATGNVVVVYKAYRVTANQTEVDMAQNQLRIKQGFVMQRYEQRFEGRILDYNLARDEGVAQDVSLVFGGAYVKGSRVEIKKEKIVVEDAVFTRCELSVPCYSFRARRLTIYPEWNIMVARDVLFYAGTVPIFYLPIYSVDRNTAGYANVLPETGENRTEGRYIKGKFGYYQNEKLMGTWDVDYLEKLWYRFGVTNKYVWDDASAGNIRLHYLGAKGWFTGGLTHHMLIGVENNKPEQRIANFFLGILPPAKEQFPELVLDVSSKEILGDEFVSFLPMLTVNSPKYNLPFIYPWKWDTSLSYADIQEELARKEERDDEDYDEGFMQRFRRQRWLIKTFSEYDLSPVGDLTGEFGYDKSGYYEGATLMGYWYRLYTGWTIGRRIDFWDYTLGYRHIFSEAGFSPFFFDRFNLSTKDEIGAGLGFWINDIHRLGYHVDYAVNEQEIRNEDITLDLRLHHWQVSLIFRNKLQQTFFSVTLL
jgi:hypothetical protein